MTTTRLSLSGLYRLPWSVPDNIISWIEPTKNCNLSCPGCYSLNSPGAHRPAAEVSAELRRIAEGARSDVLAIGGGEPLTYPGLTELTAEAKALGFKPFLNTNGLLATAERLKELKAAGLAGVTFHVDSLQNRPGWEGADEEKLNALRAGLGALCRPLGLTCYFSMTVTGSNLPGVPAVLRWARANPATAHMALFISYKEPAAGGTASAGAEAPLPEVWARAAEAEPGLEAAGYVNSALKFSKAKWLVSLAAVSPSAGVLGYFGPRALEALQAVPHLLRGRYPGSAAPRWQRAGRLFSLLTLWDRGARRAALRAFLEPAAWTSPVWLQPLVFIEPDTLVKDGRPVFFL